MAVPVLPFINFGIPRDTIVLIMQQEPSNTELSYLISSSFTTNPKVRQDLTTSGTFVSGRKSVFVVAYYVFQYTRFFET